MSKIVRDVLYVFRALFAVTWHRERSFVDYQVETVHSKWTSAKCKDDDYQHVMQHAFWQVRQSFNMISTQNLSNLVTAWHRTRLNKAEGNLDFFDFLAKVGVVKMGYFS